MKRREEMTFLERIYVVEVAKGVALTFRRLVENLGLHILKAFGVKVASAPAVSIQYPNERRDYPARFRGRHRLTVNGSGNVNCTACFLCATACPAGCIYIEAAEHPTGGIEKFPHRYEIDTLLCIYCGYCVEACPVDAIRMDTGIHPEVYPPDPRNFIEDKEVLMQRSKSLESVGSEELFRRHMLKIQNLEKHPEAPVNYGAA